MEPDDRISQRANLSEPASPLPEAAERRRRHFPSRRVFLFAGATLAALIAMLAGRTTMTFQQISEEAAKTSFFAFDPEPDFRPFRGENRLTVLLLGIRGVGDPEGGLLTDTVLVITIDKTTGETLLISLPRDLWVRLPGKEREDKLNAAYAIGFEEGGKAAALEYARVVAERITGLAIDHTASVDLELVRDFIDVLGGVTVTLKKPFTESKQWVKGGDMGTSSAFAVRDDQWVFELPAGKQALDGTTALYYLRARYSSNDFDRERRQQEVLLAVRERLLTLGVLLNPLKVDELLRAFERHVVTDIPITKIPEMVTLLVKAEKVRRVTLDTSPEGFLETRFLNGIYTLFPKSGNFLDIRDFVRKEIAADQP